MTFSDHVLPSLAAIFIWWMSTGLILVMNFQPRATHRWSMVGATCLAGLALYGFVLSARDTSVTGAYMAFLSALVLWGWHEMSFLMGFVTGPHKAPCPPDASGLRRFALASGTLLHHEIAIFVTGIVMAALIWGDPNQTGLWTYVVLWAMRLSAKLNIFFGVPNVTEEFLPEPMTFLKSYFRKRPMNGLFPVSVTAATVATVLVGLHALTPDLPSGARVGFSLMASMLALGLLEHWFLVLPLREAALWDWAQAARGMAAQGTTTRDGAQAPQRDAEPSFASCAEPWSEQLATTVPLLPPLAFGTADLPASPVTVAPLGTAPRSPGPGERPVNGVAGGLFSGLSGRPRPKSEVQDQGPQHKSGRMALVHRPSSGPVSS